MIHDLYIGEAPPRVATDPAEWDHRLWTRTVLAKIDQAIRSNPVGEQLFIVVRTYEPD